MELIIMWNVLATTATTQANPSDALWLTSTTATVVAALIAAVAAVVTALLNLAHNRKTLRATEKHNERTLAELRATERRKKLQVALEEVLIPLQSQLEQMKGLYQLMSAGKPEGFRTLPYLIDPGNYKINSQPVQVDFSENDRKLLEEIIDIESGLESLLTNKGALVDDPTLNQKYVPNPAITDVDVQKLSDYSLFAIAVLHFRVIRMAYKGLLKGEPERYEHFVYPRELNGRVANAIARIQGELAKV